MPADLNQETAVPLVTLSARGRDLLSKVFSLPKADNVSGTNPKDVGAQHDKMTQNILTYLGQGKEGAKPASVDQEGNPDQAEEAANMPVPAPPRNKLGTSVATITQAGLKARAKPFGQQGATSELL